jgi:hypothetical protein
VRRGAFLLATLLAAPAGAAEPAAIFDGATLAGWHASAASSHSAASGHRSGGAWRVEDGAIAGAQDTPGNGGLLVSDASWRDVEIALEVRIEWGLDSGVFLRATEDGRAYQVMVDHYPGGTIGGIYGEGLSGDINCRSFEFLERPEARRGASPVLWLPEGWNELRARIVGNPPRITTWLNGVAIVDFADTETRHPPSGHIALQVHGGGDTTGHFVRYRNIRVTPLD